MISVFFAFFQLCFYLVEQTSGHALELPVGGQPPDCFPAIGFRMPASVDDIQGSIANWWCDYNSEYAFMGFSYEVTACK